MTEQPDAKRDVATSDATTPNQQSWTESRNRVLVIVDAQVDFVMRHGLLAIAGAEAIIAPGIGLITGLDPTRYAAVLYTYDTHVADAYMGSLENVGQPDRGIPGFPLHCEKGTTGWETVFNPRLVPAGIPVFELEKDVFDAWEKAGGDTQVYATGDDRARLHGAPMDREDFFDRLVASGVDTATVIGVASDFCVKDMVRGLLKRNYHVEVIEDVTAGIARDMARTIGDEFPNEVQLVRPVTAPIDLDATRHFDVTDIVYRDGGGGIKDLRVEIRAGNFDQPGDGAPHDERDVIGDTLVGNLGRDIAGFQYAEV